MVKISRHFKKISLFFGLVLGPLTAYSQAQTGPVESSRENRGDGRYTLLLQPFGLGEGIQTAGRLEYAQTAQKHFGLMYQSGEELSDLFDTYSAHSNLLAVYAREFVGNSFYLEAGLATHQKHVRTLDYTYDFRANGSLGVAYYEEQKYTRSDFGVLFGIGNQWQWENFTLGCEWVGAYVPIGAAGFASKAQRHYDNGLIEDVSPNKRNNKMVTSLRALNFALGWQF